jgi:hypothetical protein
MRKEGKSVDKNFICRLTFIFKGGGTYAFIYGTSGIFIWVAQRGLPAVGIGDSEILDAW